MDVRQRSKEHVWVYEKCAVSYLSSMRRIQYESAAEEVRRAVTGGEKKALRTTGETRMCGGGRESSQERPVAAAMRACESKRLALSGSEKPEEKQREGRLERRGSKAACWVVATRHTCKQHTTTPAGTVPSQNGQQPT